MFHWHPCTAGLSDVCRRDSNGEAGVLGSNVGWAI